MSEWKQKRFWKEVSVEEDGAGFAVALDGRRVKTPAKTALVVPTRALAEAIAAEWDAQEDQIDPLSMPNTRSANAAIDKVAVQFAEVADMLAEYGDSDLLCYRAESPEGLENVLLFRDMSYDKVQQYRKDSKKGKGDKRRWRRSRYRRR